MPPKSVESEMSARSCDVSCGLKQIHVVGIRFAGANALQMRNLKKMVKRAMGHKQAKYFELWYFHS